jgi:hypothetical protein
MKNINQQKEDIIIRLLSSLNRDLEESRWWEFSKRTKLKEKRLELMETLMRLDNYILTRT